MTYGSVSAVAPPRAYQPLATEERCPVFQLLACNLACLAIAGLYYAWRDVHTHRRKRERLNDRVAYMLWVAANRTA
ncbi:MAG: hypothetical protein FJ304_25280 [Planctomycetes bacterium]|nr:hypothetical protein [Planctomycetota bacterium]